MVVSRCFFLFIRNYLSFKVIKCKCKNLEKVKVIKVKYLCYILNKCIFRINTDVVSQWREFYLLEFCKETKKNPEQLTLRAVHNVRLSLSLSHSLFLFLPLPLSSSFLSIYQTVFLLSCCESREREKHATGRKNSFKGFYLGRQGD